MTSLALLWSDYSGLAAIMSLALMSTVSLDQFSLMRGKWHLGQKVALGSGLEKQPLRQFLKYQFLGGTTEEATFLVGLEKLGPIRFFAYNFCSTVIWLSVVFAAGIVFRIALNEFFGRFGPVEFEVIAGILSVYIFGLAGTVILKRINPARKI